jgi:hypothetical protein
MPGSFEQMPWSKALLKALWRQSSAIRPGSRKRFPGGRGMRRGTRGPEISISFFCYQAAYRLISTCYRLLLSGGSPPDIHLLAAAKTEGSRLLLAAAIRRRWIRSLG